MALVENYGNYYKEKLEASKEFQDFANDLLWENGIVFSQYSSRKYQLEVGESAAGIEVKFDDKLKDTGNLFIEISEKSSPRPGPYVPSGIYRSDNSWLYAIGDYSRLYIFAHSTLRSLHGTGRFKVIENGTKTSQGFLLPAAVDGEKYAAKILIPRSGE